MPALVGYKCRACRESAATEKGIVHRASLFPSQHPVDEVTLEEVAPCAICGTKAHHTLHHPKREM